VDLLPIGEAARRLDLSPSALRYYDARGLVPAHRGRGGQRLYGPDELRRLAFIKIAQRLALPLDVAATILDAPGPRWRETVHDQIAELEQLIEQARGAQVLLTHAVNCPAEHPTRDCPNMTQALDELVAGASVERLRERYAGDGPSADG
jgi:DNA-binding transcriptional MerR regulator